MRLQPLRYALGSAPRTAATTGPWKNTMFRIITIEREYGCGGGAIAAELAHRLGWKLWDRLLTEEIARLANVQLSAVSRCDERMDSSFYRLAKAFWRGS